MPLKMLSRILISVSAVYTVIRKFVFEKVRARAGTTARVYFLRAVTLFRMFRVAAVDHARVSREWNEYHIFAASTIFFARPPPFRENARARFTPPCCARLRWIMCKLQFLMEFSLPPPEYNESVEIKEFRHKSFNFSPPPPPL